MIAQALSLAYIDKTIQMLLNFHLVFTDLSDLCPTLLDLEKQVSLS